MLTYAIGQNCTEMDRNSGALGRMRKAGEPRDRHAIAGMVRLKYV